LLYNPLPALKVGIPHSLSVVASTFLTRSSSLCVITSHWPPRSLSAVASTFLMLIRSSSLYVRTSHYPPHSLSAASFAFLIRSSSLRRIFCSCRCHWNEEKPKQEQEHYCTHHLIKEYMLSFYRFQKTQTLSHCKPIFMSRNQKSCLLVVSHQYLSPKIKENKG